MLRRYTPLRPKTPLRAKKSLVDVVADAIDPQPKKKRAKKKSVDGYSVGYAQQLQRQRVRERSGGKCEFEIRYTNVKGMQVGEFIADRRLLVETDAELPGRTVWQRCGKSAGDTAHIFRRFKCGEARDKWEVVIDACRECHVKFDHYHKDRRVPLRYAQLAFDTILADANDEASTIALLGPRPIEGEGLYR